MKMSKNYIEVINNLKYEIINSIIEEFETYNKNEIYLWRFDVDDDECECAIIDEWSKLTLNYFDGTTCIANKFYKNDNNKYVIYYEVEDNNGNEMTQFEVDIEDIDLMSVDMYNALYNSISNIDVKKANLDNND